MAELTERIWKILRDQEAHSVWLISKTKASLSVEVKTRFQWTAMIHWQTNGPAHLT